MFLAVAVGNVCFLPFGAIHEVKLAVSYWLSGRSGSVGCSATPLTICLLGSRASTILEVEIVRFVFCSHSTIYGSSRSSTFAPLLPSLLFFPLNNYSSATSAVVFMDSSSTLGSSNEAYIHLGCASTSTVASTNAAYIHLTKQTVCLALFIF